LTGTKRTVGRISASQIASASAASFLFALDVGLTQAAAERAADHTPARAEECRSGFPRRL